MTAGSAGRFASSSSATREKPSELFRVSENERGRLDPPMWNVRLASGVRGTSIDCAAMTPTAAPSSTNRPVARSIP